MREKMDWIKLKCLLRFKYKEENLLSTSVCVCVCDCVKVGGVNGFQSGARWFYGSCFYSHVSGSYFEVDLQMYFYPPVKTRGNNVTSITGVIWADPTLT